jgi:hypothetical protein
MVEAHPFHGMAGKKRCNAPPAHVYPWSGGRRAGDNEDGRQAGHSQAHELS